jgi:hypothetical protein
MEVVDLGEILWNRVTDGGSKFRSLDRKQFASIIGLQTSEMGLFLKVPDNKVYSFFCLRVLILFSLLLMFDAIHDFGENSERNKLSKEQQSEFTRNLIEFYKSYLGSQVFDKVNALSYLQFINSKMYESINSVNIKDILSNKYTYAENCINYLGITSLSIEDITNATISAGITPKCSSRSAEFEGYLKVVYSNLSIVNNNFGILLAVDADKSKYSTSNISNIACDMYSISDNFHILQSNAADYDSASTPGLITLVNEFAKKYSRKNIIKKDTSDNINYTLKINNIILMNYTYQRVSGYSDLGNLINEYRRTGNLGNIENINIIQNDFGNIFTTLKGNITNPWIKTNGKPPPGWGDSKQKFVDKFYFGKGKNKTILSKSIEDLIGKFIQKNPEIFDILFQKTDVGALQVNNFFGLPNPNGLFNSRNIHNSGQVSVGDITSYSEFINNIDKLDSIYLSSYKTIGDLGQIVALKTYQSDVLKVFLTFDQICSMVSSLFLNAAIFENSKNTAIDPLSCYVTIFEKERFLNELNAITGLKMLSEYRETPGRSNKRPRVDFGKKAIPSKIKTLAKKYKISIKDKSVKKITSEIKKLKKVQKQAKKLKIKITRRSKSGKRNYKSTKQLLSEIKRHH